jgi:hypothetical protein
MYSIQIKDARIQHQQKITEVVVGTVTENISKSKFT